MSNIDSPAGVTGGPVSAPGLDDLPEKMRVHALAKLIGRTSREVLAALVELGVEAKSAQSSIDRKAAEQVVSALVSAPAPADRSAPPPAEQSAPAPAAPMVPLFAAPLFQEPVRPTRSRRKAAEPADDPTADTADPTDTTETAHTTETTGPGEAAEEAPAPRRRSRSRRTAAAESTEPAPEPAPQPADADTDAEADDQTGDGSDTDDEDDGSGRRRRRRGRRGRGRGRGGDESSEESDESGDDSDEESGEESGDAEESDGEESSDESDDSDDQGDGSRRRRRRRRRRGSADDGGDDDPPGTVTRVRTPREARSDHDDDGVQSVRGSTRLEAKRQRRRDGRDAGRRRVPVLSEAEFLARREAVDRAMVVRERGERVEIGVLEDGVLVEHFIADSAKGSENAAASMVGNIYLGRVQNVLPSMEAAFVDIGRGRNAVLYAGEVDWDAAGLGGKARRIEQALSSGDAVLVQVTKDPVGHKGARLTTQISLAGRFLVYVPSGGAAGISRKLPDIERKRLKDMLKEIVPSEAGVIIRTASEGVSHEALERDVRRLQAQWEVVKGKAEATGPSKPKAPTLLYEEPDLLIKVVRDQFNEDFTSLVIEGDDAWDTLSGYVGHVAPELSDRMSRHIGPRDVFTEHRIDEQLLKALDRKVWLPSGGTLVIDRTEAMTVVDVNTGKFTGSGGNLEETVTRNNLEAAEEIVRQLRLRDIGGIIVIDFIDMVLEANRDLVLRRLTECLARDRTRHQVAEVTSLGLVQMTRKRVGGGLLEHFSTPCDHCRGRGIVVSTEPLTEKGADRPAGRTPDREGGRRTRGGRGRRDTGEHGHDAGADGGDGSAADGRSRNGAEQIAAVAAASVVEAPVVEAPVVGAGAVNGQVRHDEAQPAVEPAPVTVGEPVADDPPAETAAPARARRRGRVTRTAGAPAAAADGEAPAVAVVTVSARPESEVAGETPAVVPQPEPTVVSRPRRARRTASRPAGPPVDVAPDGGGDPA